MEKVTEAKRPTFTSAISRAFCGERSETYVKEIPSWKRGFDIALILFSAPAWLPLMGIIALYIKCVSKGPLFYRHERIGLRGRGFVCLKFRTMAAGADTNPHQNHLKDLIRSNRPMTKMDRADSRVIPFGRLLRASGLDELPQIFNILRGEMSFVGPRPCLPYEYELYDAHERQRCQVLPGLTGLWQVCGKNKTTFKEMIDLDLRYARECSVRMDLKIVLKTFATLAMQIKELILR